MNQSSKPFVLLFEDNPDHAETLLDALKEYIDIFPIIGGIDILEFIQEKRARRIKVRRYVNVNEDKKKVVYWEGWPDLFIFDYRLPDSTGIEEWKKLGRPDNVIFYSIWADDYKIINELKTEGITEDKLISKTGVSIDEIVGQFIDLMIQMGMIKSSNEKPCSSSYKLKIARKNYKNATIDDYLHDVAWIWERDLIERSIFDLWLHIQDHTSRITRAITTHHPPMVIDDIADTTIWLLSFIAQCHSSDNAFDTLFRFNTLPSEIIWNKYPGECPNCFDTWIITFLDNDPSSHPLKTKFEYHLPKIKNDLKEKAKNYNYPPICTCLNRMVQHEEEKKKIDSLRSDLDTLRLEYAKLNSNKKKYKLSDLEKMFSAMYSNKYNVLTLDTIAFHLLEEVGAATQALKDCYTYDNAREPFSKALHTIRRNRLLDEIADIFAWIFATVNKIKIIYGTQAYEYLETIYKKPFFNLIDNEKFSHTFSDILWSKYGCPKTGDPWEHLKCPGCQTAPCECSRDLRINWKLESATDIEPCAKSSHKILPHEDQENARDLIFISYSHQDSKLFKRFKTVLKPLIQNRTLTVWDDSQIHAGDKWREKIDSALSRAKAAILLISPDFLASDFIRKSELPPLLEQAEEHGTKILWIPISDSLFEETAINDYQPLWDPNKPIASLPNHAIDTAFKKIGGEIKIILNEA